MTEPAPAPGAAPRPPGIRPATAPAAAPSTVGADLPGVQRVGAAAGPGPETGPTGVPAPGGAGGTRPAPRPGGQTAPPQQETDEAPDIGPATATTDDIVSTGISGLDAQFGGGLPNGNFVLVTSEPTTATGTFGAQYAAAGLNGDETVFFISLERPAAEVQEAVARFMDDKAKLGRLHVLDGFPMQFRDMSGDAKRRLGMATNEEPLDALEEILVDPELKAPVRFVIESFTELSHFYDHERLMRDMRLLRAMLRRLPATALVMAVTPLHEPRQVAALRHLADGVIEFDLERKGFGLYPYMSVTKMRGVAGSARLLIFKETETGLWIESTKRVF